MLDEKDLQAIANLIDVKLDARISESEKRMATMMDAKLTQQKAEILSETNSSMNLLIENIVMPRFDFLADGIQDIQEKLVPRCRVDDLEEEVRFLKSIVRQITDDVQQLKKAN